MDEKNKYCLYQHTRKSDSRIFYIGIGDNKRPYSKKGRNKYWKHIVNKHDYNVKILVDTISWERACELEKLMISFYGRIDKKEGVLVNLTDGGEGTKGRNHSEKTKKILKEKMIGIKKSEETKKKMRKPKSEETKKNMKKNHADFSGKNHPQSRKVICDVTNKIYDCIKDAAKDIGVNYNTLRNWITGRHTNKSSLRFL